MKDKILEEAVKFSVVIILVSLAALLLVVTIKEIF